MRKNPQIFWTIIFITLTGILWIFFANKKDSKVSVMDSLISADKNVETLPIGEGQTVETASIGKKKYTHGQLGFSFEYSKKYTISSFGNFFDSNGETVLLQDEVGVQGLQVLITPFDENIDLTIKRIKKDLPSLSMSQEKELQIGQDNIKVQVVVFNSNNNLSTGESIEGWFVYNKNLYQISATKESKELFDIIIDTWNLED